MFWLAILSVLGLIACVIIHLYQKHPDYYLLAEDVEKMETGKHNA